jgi:hypothetical protein
MFPHDEAVENESNSKSEKGRMIEKDKVLLPELIACFQCGLFG